MAREQDSVDLNRVRIPSKLLSTLDGFFSDLKMQILEDAVTLRARRPGVDRDCVLTEDDLLAVAGAVIEQAASNLHIALSRCRSEHVRRAS